MLDGLPAANLLQTPWSGMSWQHAPPQAQVTATGALEIHTGDQTDFWQATHYGFTHSNGHALLQTAPSEFTACVRVCGDYLQLYDQAGLMVWADETHWLKAGVEYVGQGGNQRQQWSAVLTRDFSDWSVMPAGAHAAVWFRVIRRADTLIVHARPDSRESAPAPTAWTLLRLAYFPPTLPVRVGVMACSPQRAGFQATFDQFTLTPPDARSLHELTQP
ncbi:DUF1349 domain-containing protein [Deinococcus oregonensis]|uniref:DUF1349 domain-containing protein n=1 Tax=Deinococcus oregonensis TaxID=1805970 RepID=A0ABV6AWF9_9DEIO